MPSADGDRCQRFPPAAEPLTPARLSTLAAALRTAGAGLSAMPVHAIIATVNRALTRLAGTDAVNVAKLAAASGYHPATVRAGLRDLSLAFSTQQLEHLIEREIGGPGPLDGFAARPDGRGWSRAFGPALSVLVMAGSVYPAVAESVILCLLAKSPCLLKLPSRDPAFALMLCAALAGEDERLGRALAAVSWPAWDHQMHAAAFGAAETVIAYGGAEAMAAVRALVPPAVRLITHGPKLSLAVIPAADAQPAAVAEAVAADVAAYDQQGCVSPHTIYVTGSLDSATAFGERVAAALAAREREQPRGMLTPSAAVAIRQARGAAEFRPGAAVFASSGSTAWTVIVDPEPAFAVSCLNRLVYIKPIVSLAALPAALAPVAPYLQTAGAGGDDAFRLAVAEVCGPLGVARVCPLGQMQQPPADWRHDGRPRLLELLRWTDIDRTQAAMGAARPTA